MRCMHLSSEVQVASDDDRFIRGHRSEWFRWMEVNIIKGEVVKEENDHVGR